MTSVALVVVDKSRYEATDVQYLPSFLLQKLGSGDNDVSDNNHIGTCVQWLRCIEFGINGDERWSKKIRRRNGDRDGP